MTMLSTRSPEAETKRMTMGIRSMAAGPSYHIGTTLPSPATGPSTTPAKRRFDESHFSDDGYRILRCRGGGSSRRAKFDDVHSASSSPRNGPTSARRRVTRAQRRRNSSPSLPTDLETIAMEDNAVKKEIMRLGLVLRDVQGDGNCLFRAMADQLWGLQKRHVEVRKLVCDYLQTHKESMEGFVTPFMKDGEVYEAYIQRMRQPKTFGSHIEIQAAARIFQRDIRVIMSTTSFTIPWQSESTRRVPGGQHNLEDEDVTGARDTRSGGHDDTTSLAPMARPGRTMLWLALFSQAEHFQSVRSKSGGENGPAEVEDRMAIPHESDDSEAARRDRGEMIGKPAPEANVAAVLASLPAGHGFTPKQVEGVLARVKGNLGEAVSILVEDLQLEDESLSESLDVDYRDRSSSPSSLRSGSTAATSDTSKITTPSNSSGSEQSIQTGIDGLKMMSNSPSTATEYGMKVRARARRAHRVSWPTH